MFIKCITRGTRIIYHENRLNGMRRLIVILAIILMIVPLCGCTVTTQEPLKPVPDNVDTTPVLASELLAEWVELKEKYESEGEDTRAMLDELQAMAAEPNPDYKAMYDDYEWYYSSLIWYRTTLRDYYYVSILLGHTTPTADDQLSLRKDTIPFGRPDGDTYTMGELNMEGEGVMHITNMIESYIKECIAGHDSRQDVIDWLDTLEEYLPGYYDMEIGYAYYWVNSILSKQSRYSYVLIEG